MGSLAAQAQITDQDIRSTTSTQGGAQLGQRVVTSDGKAYRYGLNGTGSGTALVAGQLQQGATVVSNHQNRTGVTAVAGQNVVTFTCGATTATVNAYYQGYLNVNAGTGAGQMLEISGSTAITAAGSYSVTVNLYDSIITATLVSDSKFSLIPNLYSACIISAATLAAGATGVPNVNIPDAYYGWLQVNGEASVLSDAGAPASGAPVTYSDDTAGAVGPYETDAVGVVLGYATQLGVSAEYRAVFLTIN
jgi:hypothetical protein